MTGDPLRTYEYDLIEQMEALLHSFHFDVLDKGASAREAEKRLANAELFLIQYHTYHYLDELSSLTPERVFDFVHTWYFERIEMRSESDWKETVENVGLLLNYIIRTEHHLLNNSQSLIDAVNTELPFEEHEKNYQHQPLINEIDDDIPLDDLVEDERGALGHSIESFEHFTTFGDMVASIQQTLSTASSRKNIIPLAPSAQGTLQLQALSETNDIQQFIFDLLRGNRIFIRWLERKRRRLSDLRSELRNRYQHDEAQLAHLHQLSRNTIVSDDDIHNSQEVIDHLDKQMWSLRNRIAAELRLDLRSLCL